MRCGADVQVGCVVMASGVARRFGSQKLLAPLAGIPILERTIRALVCAGLSPIVVVRSKEIADLCHGLRVRSVLHEGPLQSDTVRRALDESDDWDGCLFMPGDQPLVSVSSLRALVFAFQKKPYGIWRLAWRGNEGSPVIFPRDLFDDVRAVKGDRGGSGLLMRRDDLRDRVYVVEAGCKEELFDIDTPEELAELEELLKEKCKLQLNGVRWIGVDKK